MNKTIENLKKLKSFHNGSYGADIDKAIEVLEKTRWIPCSERLPELDVNVNVYTKKNPIMVSKPVYISYKFDGRDYVCPIPCILHSNGNWYNDSDSLEDWVNLDDYDSWTDSPLSNLEVTAWMPLPEPYKADNENKQGLAYADQNTLMSAT